MFGGNFRSQHFVYGHGYAFAVRYSFDDFQDIVVQENRQSRNARLCGTQRVEQHFIVPTLYRARAVQNSFQKPVRKQRDFTR